jgi:transposase
MLEKFRQILDGLPEKPPPSRLTPYRELIGELRQRGRTFREIADILREKCGVQVSLSTLHDFVCSRLKGKSSGSLRSRAQSEGSEPSGVTADDVQERIDKLKRRPAVTSDTRNEFSFDETEPLRLSPKPK